MLRIRRLCLWLSRIILQTLELLHFALGLSGLPLLAINSRQPEMCLRRQRTFLLDGEQLRPCFLSRRVIAFERCRLPQRIKRLRHVGQQAIGAQKFRTRLMRLATGFPSRKRHASPNIHFYQEFTLRSHGVRRAGSAALDLAYVACGRMDGFWEFNLNPWDTAAGILLVEEAGGRVTDFARAHYRLASDEILASNGLIHEELIGFFEDMFAGRNLAPIPTPEEFARTRKSKEQGTANRE